MKGKFKTWLIVGLGALGVAFLSGAFEKFFNWDKAEGLTGALFTAGAAVAGAYLAHSAGIIDGNTRNMVIGAGIAVGVYNGIGGKVYDWGADLAAKIGGKGGSRTPRMGPDGLPDDSDYDAVRDAPDPAMFGGGPASGFSAGPGGSAPAGSNTAPSAAPVYNVNVEAAKIPKADFGVELTKTLGGVAESFFGSGIFGSGSSNRGNRRAVPLGAL